MGYWPEADILVVQKRVNEDVLNQVQLFKSRGGSVVYDCDDLGKALDYWAASHFLESMLKHADMVTTNTESFRNVLRTKYNVRSVELIPDVIDYYSQGPVRNPLADEQIVRILWFGNRSNLHLLRKYLDAFLRIPDCNLIICCDETPELATFIHERISYIPWNLSTFIHLLRSCHFTFLPHDGGPEDRAKSNNRMITSLAWGVPAIVSRTPEYERLANLVGQPQCVIDNTDQLISAIAYWRPESARKRYLDAAQPVVWKHHSPDAVAKRISELLRLCARFVCAKTDPVRV